MEAHQRDKLVQRILLGKVYCRVDDKLYYMKTPTTETLNMGHMLYDEAIQAHRFSGWITRRRAKVILAKEGIWDEKSEKNLKDIETRIEDLKIELYEGAMGQKSSIDETRKILKMVQEKHKEMIGRKYLIDHLTLEGYAERRMNYFNAVMSQYDEHGNPLCTNWQECNVRLAKRIITQCAKQQITVSQYRELARTDPWRSYWGCHKESNFKVVGDEQRSLCLYSKMYDNAYGHPECPPEKILEDDDMFDGWLAIQRRKHEKAQMDSQLDKAHNISAKHGNAQEIFLPASSQSEANRIYNRNDLQNKIIQKQRLAKIKNSKTPVTDSSLPDKQLELQLQANQQFISTVKGNK